MIHVIPHHVKRGAWPAWHKLIDFTETINVLDGYDINSIERCLDSTPPSNNIEKYIIELNVNPNDSVVCDKHYFIKDGEDFDTTKSNIINLSKKYKCKFFIVDDDNNKKYSDNIHFTYFSNRFNINDESNNFNYFKYRTPIHNWTNNLSELLNPFLSNTRQKKFNFIVGVDKVERLTSLKHIYNNKMESDGYIGYSAFVKGYEDSVISNQLIQFRDSTIPIILDIPFEKSVYGDVNVEYPPFPICLNSYVSCICETAIIDSDEIHLSEKAWNPFISHNIPLILGSKYINKYLKELGFWLADDLFDIKPKDNRTDILNQFTSNLDIINSISYNDLYKYYYDNIDHIKRNFDILMKQKFIFDRKNYL